MAVVSTIFTKDIEKMEYIYINGDSNTQGLLPAPDNAWNFKIGIGEKTEKPWPIVMEETLNKLGIPVSIENISECGRRLAGKTHNKIESCSLGAKDGRVALQQMIGTIFNRHGIKSEGVNIYINLGTNDLQDHRISTEYLKGSMIKHLLTILTQPNLQYTLWKSMKSSSKETMVSNFFENLTKYMSDDIRKSYSCDVPVTHDPASSIETLNHGEDFEKLIEENLETIRELFSMISWNITFIPSVLLKGRPFGAFPSAHLSQHWTTMIKEIVDLFNIKNICYISEAQLFSIPECDEFGGSLHLTPEQHLEYGLKMAKYYVINKKNTELEKMQRFLTDAIGSKCKLSSLPAEAGEIPSLLLPAFEATKKRQLPTSGIIKQVADYAIDVRYDDWGHLKFK